MDAPWILRRETIASPLPMARAQAEIQDLLTHGVELRGIHRDVYGLANGRRFSVSFGLPLLGGLFPVLRGRLEPSPRGVDVHASIGMRLEPIVVSIVFLAIGLGFGGYQVLRELGSEVGSTAQRLGAALDVLPRASLFVLPVLVNLLTWRYAANESGEDLLEAVEIYLDVPSNVANEDPEPEEIE